MIMAPLVDHEEQFLIPTTLDQSQKEAGHINPSTLNTKKVKDLKALCDEYGIRVQGRRKSDYIAAILASHAQNGGVLLKFQSKNHPQPEYMLRHKGPRPTPSPAKYSKRSTKRWQAINDSLSSGSVPEQYHKSRLSVQWATALLEMDKKRGGDDQPSSSTVTVPSDSSHIFSALPGGDASEKAPQITASLLWKMLEICNAPKGTSIDRGVPTSTNNPKSESMLNVEEQLEGESLTTTQTKTSVALSCQRCRSPLSFQ
ncbi:hypothetical protein HYPSUDRAFT_855985 [Hypholoma sublateritium FD-334 SS-4]|uniref:Rho termination factor-like N-terminal domain-containing protein n=1 Tax=Hypholoma sublateritium (strain FD-334 SS-4) TaxID=945553 RepID=A0A0D2KZ26_HYPSF|nr:hypothetical protein HYPSUDRAFT_855985 [Hypholoma sublateritium FD-334 SS-4]